MYYELKSKISSRPLELTAYFLNETKRAAKSFKGLEKNGIIIRTVWVNSTGYLLQLCKNRYILIIFSAFSASKLFPMLYHAKPYIEKIHYIDAELAGHVHKLDVKLQSMWWRGFSLFPVRILAKLRHFGVNWPTLCENRDGSLHFFTLKLEWHNSYNNLLSCDSANGDIA